MPRKLLSKTVCYSCSFDLYLATPEQNSEHRITIEFTKNSDNSIRLIPTYRIYLYSHNNVYLFIFKFILFVLYMYDQYYEYLRIYKIHYYIYLHRRSSRVLSKYMHNFIIFPDYCIETWQRNYDKVLCNDYIFAEWERESVCMTETDREREREREKIK